MLRDFGHLEAITEQSENPARRGIPEAREEIGDLIPGLGQLIRRAQA
jgi:hypothetical protein